MVDIEVNAWSSLFLNLQTNLILYLYPEKCIKFNQSESRIRSQEILIWKPFKINIQKQEGRSYFEKPVFDFSVIYPKKSGLSKQLKVSTLGIWIKQSGLKVSHSKVPSSGQLNCMWESLRGTLLPWTTFYCFPYQFLNFLPKCSRLWCSTTLF